jgi:uncharacterized protein with HEPN domain
VTRGDDLRTLDILEACSSLAEVVRARGAVDEEILLRAAERLLEIIGEAATNCSQALKDRHPEVDWEGIAGLRVVLAHHYHRTQPDLIWQFASVEAPQLLIALRA